MTQPSSDELLEFEQLAAHSGDEQLDVQALIAEAKAQLEARQAMPDETRRALASNALRQYFDLVEFVKRPWRYLAGRQG